MKLKVKEVNICDSVWCVDNNIIVYFVCVVSSVTKKVVIPGVVQTVQ